MTIALRNLGIALLLLSGLFSWGHKPEAVNAVSSMPVSDQQKSSHMLMFADAEGNVDAECTGTVIGPHALLTAEHCNPHDVDKAILFDLSPVRFQIVAASHDGEDHVIYLLSGPEFHDIDSALTRDPKIGEDVYLYGFGGGHYPSTLKTGKVASVTTPSELDREAKMTYFTILVIPGDSGSAIYGPDGDIVALLTWHITRLENGQKVEYSGGYPLDFSVTELNIARTWAPQP